MDVWVWPAYVGLLLGVLAFALLLVPVLAQQYHRYGQFSVRRVLGAAAVSVYGTSLIAYTLLPLPATRGDWCASAAQARSGARCTSSPTSPRPPPDPDR